MKTLNKLKTGYYISIIKTIYRDGEAEPIPQSMGKGSCVSKVQVRTRTEQETWSSYSYVTSMESQARMLSKKKRGMRAKKRFQIKKKVNYHCVWMVLHDIILRNS